MTAGLDPEMLRTLVREVLADLLPAQPAQPGQPLQPAQAATPPASTAPPPAPAPSPAPADGYVVGNAPYMQQSHHISRDQAGFAVWEGVEVVEVVSLRTDRELAAFVSRLLRLLENPKHRADLRTGRLRFTLAPAGAAGSVRPAHRIERGAVTEAAVREAARAGARLVLGRRAVLTPLARDRARAAGVEIEKEH